MRNIMRCLGVVLSAYLICSPAHAQMYSQDNYYGNPYADSTPRAPNVPPVANLQYDQRDAEMILRDQMARSDQDGRASQPPPDAQAEMYDRYTYGHRVTDEEAIKLVMAEARYVSRAIKKRNGKSFVVIDKRNFQFYLYDRLGHLLRIGPVAIGKGKTRVGAFETPVGVFPIKSKVPVADWVRPNWYFIEENEPIPQNWEDRRVPGFFRYKLVFDGTRYIHYAEATGGRLTHGCLGLDWQDAEAVFHTLHVGSYAIIIDDPFLKRLARGEFPIVVRQKKKPAYAGPTVTAKAGDRAKTFGNMW